MSAFPRGSEESQYNAVLSAPFICGAPIPSGLLAVGINLLRGRLLPAVRRWIIGVPWRLPHLVGEREHIVTYLIYYIGKDFRIF